MAVPTAKWNVVFILADDLGYGDLSVYNPDGLIQTPVLDSLANHSLRFTQAHASAAVSTPTRYGLLTGQYPWRSSLKEGVLWAWAKPLIREEVTLPALLREANYRTALVGKWHLGVTFPTRAGRSISPSSDGSEIDFSAKIIDGPLQHGFDYYYGDDVPNFPPYVFIENDSFIEPATQPLPAGLPGVKGVRAPSWSPEKLLSVESDRACAYIHMQRGSDQPFFLMVALTAPHTPIAPRNRYIGHSRAGRYGDFVEEMDACIGEILEALRQTGLDKNTIVIFSSDNGSSFQDGGTEACQKYAGRFGSILDWGHNPSERFRGMKSDAWEGGHRIPMMIRWPHVTDRGWVSDALICDLDIYATLAEVAGIYVPLGVAVDSHSFVPLIMKAAKGKRENVVCQSGNGVLTYIADDWKLIAGSGGGGSLNPYEESGLLPEYVGGKWRHVQLYNLHADSEEHNNLAGQQPQRVETMMEALAAQIHLKNDTTLWKQVRWVSYVPSKK